MKTNTNSKYLIAVLIDGDNLSFERMEDIMGFVSRYGDAVIRRIYGDWTRKALSGWKETITDIKKLLSEDKIKDYSGSLKEMSLVITYPDISKSEVLEIKEIWEISK